MKKLFILSLFLLISLSCSSDAELSGNTRDGQGGSLAIFAMKENYLYTVDQNSLNVFSLINPHLPSKVNEVWIGFSIETIFAHEEFLYIGSRDGMYIYSIANPENPQLVSAVQHFRACDPVVSNGTHSFVTLHSGTVCGGVQNVLQVYDTSDPAAPVLIHSRSLVHPKGLGLYHHFLIVCDDQIKIFDIANPEEPVLVRSIDMQSFDVIIKDDTMFAIGDEKLVRYTLNADPQLIQMQSQINF